MSEMLPKVWISLDREDVLLDPIVLEAKTLTAKDARAFARAAIEYGRSILSALEGIPALPPAAAENSGPLVATRFEKILAAAAERTTAVEIARKAGLGRENVSSALSELRNLGRVQHWPETHEWQAI